MPHMTMAFDEAFFPASASSFRGEHPIASADVKLELGRDRDSEVSWNVFLTKIDLDWIGSPEGSEGSVGLVARMG